jgi:hypothetical protein
LQRRDSKVNAFATGLKHPRWIHVLSNGDVLVAEATNAETAMSLFDYAMKRRCEGAGGAGVQLHAGEKQADSRAFDADTVEIAARISSMPAMVSARIARSCVASVFAKSGLHVAFGKALGVLGHVERCQRRLRQRPVRTASKLAARSRSISFVAVSRAPS